MKRTPLRPSSSPIRTRTRAIVANRTRKAKEFARCYHSKARVVWVKAHSCVVKECDERRYVENAHIETEGMGRKADYTKIVPLCHFHHSTLHSEGRRWFEWHHCLDLDRLAELTQAAWECVEWERA